MLYDIAKRIKNNLPLEIQLAYLKLHETDNSYGEWFADEN
jgi:6-pyruvoyltetrahydropterin/6-carboxytetrahydropterin synthase